MNVLALSDNSIQEIVEGKDYELPRFKNKITYFKYMVRDDIKSMKVELLGIPKNFMEEEIE